MYGYIYETTNLINGKKYIGQHKASEFHEWYKGSGKYLWNAINKYGWSNFETRIIEECNSYEELQEKEKYWIKYFDAVNSEEYYNITEGGYGTTGHHHSEETKKRMSKVHSKENLSEETRRKMSESRLGENNHMYNKQHTPETRVKISTTSGDKNPMYGKHHTEETRSKISKSSIGLKWITDPETNKFKRVKGKDLEYYLNNGWILGRIRGVNLRL